MNVESAKYELNEILSTYEQRAFVLDKLEMAQWHYSDLIGITCSGSFEISQLSLDRAKYPHFLKQQDGLVVFDEEQCALFMSENHNLPLPLCTAYVLSKSW